MASKKELQEQLAISEQIIQANVELQKQLGEIATKQEEISYAVEKRKINAQEMLKFAAQTTDERREQYDKEKEQFDLAVAKGELLGEERKFREADLEQKRQMKDLEDDALKTAQALYEVQIKQAGLREKNLKNLEKSKKRLGEISKRMGGMLGIGNRLSDTMAGGLVVAAGDLANILATSEGLMENFGEKALKAADNIGDFGMGFFVGLAEEIAVTQDSVRANFIKTTGATRGFSQSAVDAADQMRMMGLDMRSAGEASTLLFQNVTAFRDATPAARKDTAVFVGTLIELGISGQAAAGNMQLLTMGMGQSLTQAAATTKALRNFAISIDMDVNQAMDDFNDLAPELIAHGSNMDNVFKGLMKISRQTGLSMQALVDVAAQFDTFEGAATAVGRLNGMLGGPYLNSIEMLYATEDERMKMMREAMTLSGRQFKDLSRYERKAVAAAAGFKSVGDAMFFFNKEAMDPKAREQAEMQESLATAARNAKPAMERLQLAIMKLGVSLEPVLQRIIQFIESLVENESVVKGVIFAIGVLWAAMKSVAIVTTLTTAFAVLTKGMAAAAMAARILRWSFVTLGTAGIIGLVILLHQLYKLLFVGSSPSLIAVFGLVTAAVWAMNLAMNANPIGLIVLGVVAAIGALYMLFEHMDKVKAMIIGLFNTVGEVLAGIAKVIFQVMMAPINAAIWALNKLISAVNYIPFVSIPEIPYITVDAIPGFANGVNNFGGGLAMVNEKGTEGIRERGGKTGLIAGGPQIANLKKGTDIVPNNKLSNSNAGVSVEDLKTAFVAALKEVGADSSGVTNIVAEQPIEVTIGKKVFGKAVMEVVKESTNLRLKPGAR